jgi:hypothetical protein
VAAPAAIAGPNATKREQHRRVSGEQRRIEDRLFVGVVEVAPHRLFTAEPAGDSVGQRPADSVGLASSDAANSVGIDAVSPLAETSCDSAGIARNRRLPAPGALEGAR